MSRKLWQTVAALISEMYADDHGHANSFIQRGVPAELQTEDVRGLSLVGREVAAYRAGLLTLATDRLIEHLEEKEVDDLLWRFVCRVHIDRLGRDPRSRRLLAREFVASLQRPWVPFQVMVQVGGFHQDVAGLSFAGLEFVKLTPTVLGDWGLLEQRRWLKWRGTVGVVTTIEAGTAAIAADRALAQVATLRDVLRIGLQESIRARLYNEQLQFESGWIAVREPGGGWKHVRLGSIRTTRDAWPRTSVNRALESLAPLTRISGGGRLDLADALARALAWASRSRDTTNPGFALFALSASLEALLGDLSDGRKGVLLALRSMLLEVRGDGYFHDPRDVHTLYEARSRLVHGAQPEVDDELVWHLRGIAERSVVAAVRLLDENSNVRTVKDWFAFLEEPGLLRSVVGQLGGIQAEPYRAMVARAESLLGTEEGHSSASMR